MLPDPGLLARPLLESRQQRRLIDVQQPPFQIDPHPLAKHAADLLAVVGSRDELVLDGIRHRRLRQIHRESEENEAGSHICVIAYHAAPPGYGIGLPVLSPAA